MPCKQAASSKKQHAATARESPTKSTYYTITPLPLLCPCNTCAVKLQDDSIDVTKPLDDIQRGKYRNDEVIIGSAPVGTPQLTPSPGTLGNKVWDSDGTGKNNDDHRLDNERFGGGTYPRNEAKVLGESASGYAHERLGFNDGEDKTASRDPPGGTQGERKINRDIVLQAERGSPLRESPQVMGRVTRAGEECSGYMRAETKSLITTSGDSRLLDDNNKSYGNISTKYHGGDRGCSRMPEIDGNLDQPGAAFETHNAPSNNTGSSKIPRQVRGDKGGTSSPRQWDETCDGGNARVDRPGVRVEQCQEDRPAIQQEEHNKGGEQAMGQENQPSAHSTERSEQAREIMSAEKRTEEFQRDAVAKGRHGCKLGGGKWSKQMLDGNVQEPDWQHLEWVRSLLLESSSERELGLPKVRK